MRNINLQSIKFLNLLLLTFLSIALILSPKAVVADADIEYDGVTDIRFSVLDNEGNIVLVGQTEKEDLYIGKFDDSGNNLWSEVFGGSDQELAKTINFDSENNIYIVGITFSSDFNVTENAYQAQHGGLSDLFVRKWNDQGQLLWSTYLGGQKADELENGEYPSVQITSDDELVILGYSNSRDFPTVNAFQNENKGGRVGTLYSFDDITVSKFDTNGNLVWSSYLGGPGEEYGYLSFDLEGNIIIRGASTASFDHPITQGLEYTANSDIFVSKINPAGELLFTSFFGGSDDEWSTWLEIDSDNNIIFIGSSLSSDYTTTPNVFQPNSIGENEIILTKIDENGQLIWSTYFGGEGLVESSVCCRGSEDVQYTDDLPKILITSENDIVFTFYTESDDITTKGSHIDQLIDTTFPRSPFVGIFLSNGTFVYGSYFVGIFNEAILGLENEIFMSASSLFTDYPTVNAVQPEHNGGVDLFLTKLWENGSLEWSTYFGGNGNERIVKSSFTSDGNILLLGTTTSGNLPGSENAYGGEEDLFVSKINFEDGTIQWTKYIGGSGTEIVNRVGILEDEDGNIIIVGRTRSGDFPADATTQPSFEETLILSKYNSQGQTEWSSVILPEARIQPDKPEDDPLLLWFALATITIVGIGIFYLKGFQLKSKSFEDVLLNKHMTEILSPLFNSHPKLIHIFGASKVFKEKVTADEARGIIPLEIMDFKYFMQPVRLSIIKLLDENVYLTTVQIKERLQIPWSELMTHLASLKKRNYVTLNQEFIDGGIRTVISGEQTVITKYHALKDVMMQFFEATPNLDKYLDYVTSIKLRSEDQDLYPK